MKKLFTILTVVLLTIISYSQAPQKLSYQAVIRNNSGQLVTSHAVGIRATILQGSPSGTMIYQETFNSLTNGNGLVSIEIGGGTLVSGNFSTINWASGSYYLRIETDPSGGTSYTISGTSQLISVPYALHAKNAASYTETDPVFGAAPAKAITSGLITNWNTAYGWGNHAGLYKLVSYVPAWSEVTGKPTSISGYGITDAVTLTGDQTISGIKTFSKDIIVNTLTVGMGSGNNNNNTSFGYHVLVNNLTGGGNTANGYGALGSNTSGDYNTAVGMNALVLNKTGKFNIGIGQSALRNNNSGEGNTAMGSNSLQANTVGAGNIAIGNGSLYSSTGSGNIGIGYNAGYSNSGNYNVFLGYMAGYWDTGSNKLYIDNQQRASQADAFQKALIYGVFNESPINQILTINGKVGIGTTLPSSQLHLVGSMFVQNGGIKIGNSQGMITENWWEFGTDSNNGTGIDFHSNSEPIDYSARIYRAAGNNSELQLVNTGAGPLVFYTNNTSKMTITSTGRVGIGIPSPAYGLDVAGEITSRSGTVSSFRLRGTSYSTLLRNDGSDFYILLTNAGDPDGAWNALRPFEFNLATGNTYLAGKTLTVLHGGNVGIGTTTPGTKLAISGLTGSVAGSQLIINGGNVYFLGSTRDIKDNIQPLNDDFDKILNTSPVSFTDKATGMPGIGYIAEDFENAGLQNLLVYENGKLVSLRYDLISVYNLEVIKELKKHIESMDKENETLRSELADLRTDLDNLKRKLKFREPKSSRK